MKQATITRRLLFTWFIVACILVGALAYFQKAYAHTSTLQNKVLGVIAQNAQNIHHTSVYVYQFKTKEETSINDDYKYYPASLMKIAFMLAYYKAAETNPEILQVKVPYPKEILTNFTQHITQGKTIQPGNTYTVDELIKSMLVHSDNSATILLVQHIDRDALKNVYIDLGIAVPDLNDINYSISVKDAAKLLQVLYDGSYVNRQLSDKALTLLKESDYKEGLIAGIPSNISVAHKFGEFALQGDKPVRQLHECGIVYYPKNPYLLCVMTDGDDFSEQSLLIKKISEAVYQEVSN
jgi:beta-lactamase class A